MAKGSRPSRPRPTPPKVDRPEPVRDVARTLWLYCEGKTEQVWADFLGKRALDCSLNVRAECPGSARTTLLRFGKEKRKEIRRAGKSSAAEDEVWLVFDRDERLDVKRDVPAVLAACVSTGIGVVYSNDCFELWPIIHCEDYARPSTASELQDRLKDLHPGYDHEDGVAIDWPALLPHAVAATARAQQLHLRDPEDVLADPSTTAWLLHGRVENGGDHEATWLDAFLEAHPRQGAMLVDRLPEPIRAEVKRRHRDVCHPPLPR